jgi:hypothetical protein
MNEISWVAINWIITGIVLSSIIYFFYRRWTKNKEKIEKKLTTEKINKSKKIFNIALVSLFVLNLLDIFSTAKFLKEGTLEGNLLAYLAFEKIGFIPASIIKMIIISGFMVFLYTVFNKLSKRKEHYHAHMVYRLTLLANAIFIAVVIWNYWL